LELGKGFKAQKPVGEFYWFQFFYWEGGGRWNFLGKLQPGKIRLYVDQKFIWFSFVPKNSLTGIPKGYFGLFWVEKGFWVLIRGLAFPLVGRFKR